jgi:hypothetical protein
MAAARDRAVRSGVATEQRADDLVTRLREAMSGDYTWVSSPFFLDLALRKPITA